MQLRIWFITNKDWNINEIGDGIIGNIEHSKALLYVCDLYFFIEDTEIIHGRREGR